MQYIALALLLSVTAAPRSYIEQSEPQAMTTNQKTALASWILVVWSDAIVATIQQLHCVQSEGVRRCRHMDERTGTEDDLADALEARRVLGPYSCTLGVCRYPYTLGYVDLTSTQATSLEDLAGAVWPDPGVSLRMFRADRTGPGIVTMRRTWAATATAAEYIAKHAEGRVR